MTSPSTGFLDWVSGSIPTSDYSMIMLQRLVPSAFNIGASDILALADAMKIFNSGLLLLASLAVGWHLLQGLVSTAHDGKALGGRWHQIWAPARVVLGLGMLTPLASGFCLAQILVLQVAVWGVGFADQVWSEYSNSVSRGKVVSYNSIPSSYDSLRGIWLLETCRAEAREIALTNNFALEDVQAQSFFGSFLTHGTAPVLETPQRRVINAGQQREYIWSYGPFCGEVTFSVPTTGASMLQNEALADVILTSASGARVDITPARRALETVKVRAVENAMMALRREAEIFVNPTIYPAERIDAARLRGIIEPIRTAYDKSVFSAVATASDAIDGGARDSFREDAQKTGWASAVASP